MRTYAAQIGASVRWGPLADVSRWAAAESLERRAPVRILTARAGERQARVIAEAVNGQVVSTSSGRTVPLSTLRRLP